MKKERQEGIELLRIFSMLCIIGGHFLLFTNMTSNVVQFSGNYYLIWFLYAINFVGTNCFILISGYFYREVTFFWKKLGRTWGTIFFYSFGIAIILMIVGLKSYSMLDLIKAATPFMNRQYWFMTDYLGLYLFSPFINLLIEHMSEKQHKNLVIISIVVFSVLPSLWIGGGLDASRGYSVMWFTVLYIVGAYIRRYGLPDSKISWGGLYVISIVGTGCSKIGIAYIYSIIFHSTTEFDSVLYCNNSPLMLLAAVSLLMLFKDLRIGNGVLKRTILTIATTVMGIYLIHMHPGLADVFWGYMEQNVNANDFTVWILYFVIILAVFFFCSMIEFLRIKTVCFAKGKITYTKVEK